MSDPNLHDMSKPELAPAPAKTRGVESTVARELAEGTLPMGFPLYEVFD